MRGKGGFASKGGREGFEERRMLYYSLLSLFLLIFTEHSRRYVCPYTMHVSISRWPMSLSLLHTHTLSLFPRAGLFGWYGMTAGHDHQTRACGIVRDRLLAIDRIVYHSSRGRSFPFFFFHSSENSRSLLLSSASSSHCRRKPTLSIDAGLRNQADRSIYFTYDFNSSFGLDSLILPNSTLFCSVSASSLPD